MPQIALTQIKKGSILSEDVYSPLGGLLMAKGTVIEEREMEVLKAFLIQHVEIEDKQSEIPISPAGAPSVRGAFYQGSPHENAAMEGKERTSFEQQYVKAVQAFKQIFQTVLGGLAVPIRDLRMILDPLLKEPLDPNKILLTLKQEYQVEDYLYYHSVAVGLISSKIARWNKFPENQCYSIGLAGALHDIGKAKINPLILNKSEKLTPQEMQELRKYTIHGYHMIKSLIGVGESLALGVLQHQEREDGSGYPLKLKSESIHPYAKIIAIADVFHAMCSKRSYQDGMSPYLVLEELLAESFGKLNPAYVRAFVAGMTQFSTGTLVELNDGTIGKIVFIDPNHPTRPMVDINTKIVNLAQNRSLVIRKVLVE